jgi:hypothetical protein
MEKKKRKKCSLVRNISRVVGHAIVSRQIHKQEFKMKSTCTTNKRGLLMQVEHKWCDGLNSDNLKHKLYMAHLTLL